MHSIDKYKLMVKYYFEFYKIINLKANKMKQNVKLNHAHKMQTYKQKLWKQNCRQAVAQPEITKGGGIYAESW